MFKKLVFAIVLMALIVAPAFSQTRTPQEMQAEEYCPKVPIAQCSSFALTNAISFKYTSTTATAATVTFATPTLTITIGGVATTYNTTSAAQDTYAELVAVLEAAHSGLDVNLGDNIRGNETCDLADHTAADILNTTHYLNLTTGLTFGAKLYSAGRRPVIYRIIANTTYGSGNSILYIYRSADPNTYANDTLIWTQTLAATTVDKDIDLSPWMLPGDMNGYLKVFIVNSAALTAGNLTILGSYK